TDKRGNPRTSMFIRDISLRIALETEREQYFRFFTLSGDPLYIADPFGCFRRVNPAMVKLTGYSEAELLSRSFLDFVVPEDRQRTLEELRQQVSTRPTMHFGNRYRCKDGKTVRLSWTAYFDKREGLTYATARDIRQQTEAEQALRKNYELLDRIFATTHFCIVNLDRDLNFVRVNRAYADACGHPPEFFFGKNHFDLYPHQENQAIFREVVASGQPFTIYARPFEFPDHPELGVTYWDWTLHPLKDGEGQVEGVLFALLDVTRQVRAMQELECRTALAELFEGLARAINEAATPEDAMQSCLSQVCIFGQWRLGRVATTAALHGDHAVPADSIWQGADLQPYANFIRASQDIDAFRETGQFVARVLRERQAVWIADLEQAPGFVRRAAALADGLRSAFAFPVLVQGKAVAFLEFYADSVRPVDPGLIAAAEIIGAQIAHLIERSQAARRQAQLAVIVENSSDAIFSSGLDGKLLTWNAAAERMFGYSAEEVTGQGFLMLIPAEERAAAASRVARVKSGIEVPSYEGVRLGKGGRRIEIAGSVSPIRDLSGNVSGISLIFRDIGERKRAERERAQLAAIVESSNDAILMRGLDRRILSWNAAAERLFGWSAREAVGQPIDLIVPPERAGTLRRFIEGAARDERLSPVETTHLRKDGTRIPTQVTFSPVKDASGRVIAHSYTVRDMSEIKQKEEDLRDSYWRLRQLSHRLRSVEEAERRAIARELHDRIGQDLSSLGLLLASLGARLPPASRDVVEKPLNDIQGLLKTMAANVRDVMAELRPPALDDYGLRAALRQLATEFTRRTGIAADLDGVDLQPRLPSVVETTMFRISQEALNNVAKHARATHVAISLHAAAERIVLEIADDGIGFDAGRTPPDQRHWGLGTMRERAEEAGIAFMLESTPGAGTRVVLEVERAAT
ncbi:MAG: PAS domain S-box protein, partial [Dokdonella sp.]